MRETRSLPHFPALPVVVNVHRRFVCLRKALRCALRAHTCQQDTQSSHTDDLARLLSPLDDKQLAALQRASGDRDVVVVWEALLTKKAPR